MFTPVSPSEQEDEAGAAGMAAAEKIINEVISRRAMRVLASTPLEEGEYIAHGLWGQELAAKLDDPLKREDYYLLDVRTREAFDEGHIAGAHHVEFKEWASPDNLSGFPLDRKIIVICDTGLMAAQVVAGLRLLGYDAVVPRTGLNGWAQTSMTPGLVEEIHAAGYPVRRVPPKDGCICAPRDIVFDRPDEKEYEVIARRAREVFADAIGDGDFGGNIINASELNTMLEKGAGQEQIFLLDLRREEDFEGVGHIEGAIRMDFDAMAVMKNLQRLPRDRKIVTICYTGNLAAQLVTVLRMLDYDAQALAYGMVGWTRTPSTYMYLKDIQKADNPLV
ncbi:MAG: rhodanese-like domain-containing protein [Thermoleophilia bacterium]|jgi:rhodanese-related sulfurtransferase